MSQPQASFHMGWSSHDLHNAVLHSVPKILVFLLLLTIGWFAASAAIVAVALGVSTLLDQADIAAAVREPVLYTVLLTCGAILAIGVGGLLVKPMQARWERMLAAGEDETSGQPAATRPGDRGHPQNFGYTRSFGFPMADDAFALAVGRREDHGQAQGTDVLNDADYNQGGQYM